MSATTLAFAADTAASSLLEKALSVAANRAARVIETPHYLPPPSPAAEHPTRVYSSVHPLDLAKVPAVLKAGHAAVGLLRWSAAVNRPGDPVVGYEVQRDSGWPTNLVYPVGLVPEFPFNADMIETSSGEFWRVRTVFASGFRSTWSISQTFPERISRNY